MTAALVTGLLAGYGIAVPVGAVATYLVALTARTSLKTGANATLGVAAADGLHALIAVIGGSTLIPLIEPVMVPLRCVSAAVLVASAVRGGVTAIRRYRGQRAATPADETPVSPVRAYFGLLGMTMLNPSRWSVSPRWCSAAGARRISAASSSPCSCSPPSPRRPVGSFCSRAAEPSWAGS